MIQYSDNIRQELMKLLPSAVLSDIACFVFYDEHPRDNKNIDVTICTKNGVLKEFYQRDLMSSISLNCISTPTEIRILRNNNSELFYLVATNDELFVLSSLDKLKIHQKLTNVDRYEVDDGVCRGQACLKVIRKDDAVPLVFDENFENLGDRAVLFSGLQADDTLPILTQLKRKLNEVKYSVKCNEQTHKEFLNLRQLSAFSNYQKTKPKLTDALFKIETKELTSALKLKSEVPWVKVCNKKIVIVLYAWNQNKEPLEDVHVLLHGTTRPSLVYTTKLYNKISTSPFWREKNNNQLKHNEETAIVAVVDLEEIKHNIISRIEFNGVISYKTPMKDHLVPFDNVTISSLDSMGEKFDVLSSEKIDGLTILAILATTESTELVLRVIKNDGAPERTIPDMFSTYLHMEQVEIANNIVIHKKSPHHTLSGTMVIFKDDDTLKGPFINASVHTRAPSQVLALIQYIYDAIPTKIIITTHDHKITAKVDQLSPYNDEITENVTYSVDYTKYASSILNQTTMILEHLDNAMIKMSESKNPTIRGKIGTEIDLFANGGTNYLEFKNKIIEDATSAMNFIGNSENLSEHDTECMVID